MKKLTPMRILLIFVGLLFLFMGVSNINVGKNAEKRHKEFNEKAKMTKGYIDEVRVRVDRDEDNPIHYTEYYTGYATYQVDGVQYQHVMLGEGTKILKQGESCTLYFNSDNPREISLFLYDVNADLVKSRMSSVLLIIFGMGMLSVAFFVEFKG